MTNIKTILKKRRFVLISPVIAVLIALSIYNMDQINKALDHAHTRADQMRVDSEIRQQQGINEIREMLKDDPEALWRFDIEEEKKRLNDEMDALLKAYRED